MTDLCPRCGFVNKPGSNFCERCGIPLAAASPPTPGPTGPPGYGAPAYAPPPNFGTIFTDTFRLYLRNFLAYFLPYLLVGAATAIPFAFLPSPLLPTTPGQPPAFNIDFLGLFLASILIAIFVSVIVGSIITGSLAYFTVQRHRGGPVDLGTAFGKGLQRFLSILGASILLGLIAVGLIIAPLVLILGGLVLGSLALVGVGALGLIVAIPIAIFIFVSLSLYAAVIVVEDRGAVEGLSRSWTLTRGRRLTLFGVYLVLGIVGGVISSAITTPVGLLRSPVATGVASAVANGIVASWSVIAAAVAYDLITRQTPPPAYSYPPPYTYPQPHTSVAPPQGGAPGNPPQDPPPPPRP